MQQGTRHWADRHHAPGGRGELHTSTWLKLESGSTVSMASTVPMVSHAPLVSLTSSIARAHGSSHRPGQNDDKRAVARRCRRRSTWSPIHRTTRQRGGVCRRSEALASLANRCCTHVIRPPSKASHGFGATGRSCQRSGTRLPVESLSNERPCVNDFHRSRGPETQASNNIDDESVAVAVTARKHRCRSAVWGDVSAGPPLRQRHNSDCGPGALHREPTPCSPTAMPMDHAASAASDPCIGSVSAPSCHLFYGPSQASSQGTRDGAGAEIRSRPAAMAWRFDRGGLSGRRKIIRASDNSG